MILVVAGLGRCGSSLTMHMLRAGGFPVLFTKHMSLEHEGMTRLPKENLWLKDNHAIKINDPHLNILPKGQFEYRFIWLTRNPKQQALSYRKMNLANSRSYLEKRDIRSSIRNKIKFIRKAEPKCQAIFKKLSSYPVLHCTFEDIIKDPELYAHHLKIIASPTFYLDKNKMAVVVKPRTSDCYDGLMELE